MLPRALGTHHDAAQGAALALLADLLPSPTAAPQARAPSTTLKPARPETLDPKTKTLNSSKGLVRAPGATCSGLFCCMRGGAIECRLCVGY